ncbi:MAG TPA: hypothetical protein VHD35_16835 [Chitinophagaceae bacterium]|jgi:hypothetical protein|nr:hypothetical protein [Chitinophagaceae bacterium]
MTNSPWANGPKEILKHGLELLQKDSDTNRRLAIISIDNAVELMIKTFLGLPSRINGLKIPRKEYNEFSESFPKLLDALENYAPKKIIGLDLGDIEWYHRLRNQLYHQGNGLTVEKTNVEVYAQLANLLFKNLFGQDLVIQPHDPKELLGEFLSQWVFIEIGLHDLAQTHSLLGTKRNSVLDAMNFLRNAGLIEDEELKELNDLRTIRNTIVHGHRDYKTVLTKNTIERVKYYADRYKREE